ncbi:FAD-dependent monooxygenase [Nocardia zapadnayensis]|nr:FAD-dependent monooxygenase [Nocardia zapadnayensis]MCX0275217.1 FAD-dependent monooxygenase [Nocardia zapadnayensis]
MDRKAFFDATSVAWQELDPDEYPFMHAIVGQAREHDDREQFLTGIAIVLDGLSRLRWLARSGRDHHLISMRKGSLMYDVLIAGGGPVGLSLAGELALAGCSVLVVERDEENNVPLQAFPLGMRGLTAGSVEAFYRRALLEAIVNASGADEN